MNAVVEKNTILIVDDDETNLDLLSVILASEEYKLLTVDNGKNALDIVKSDQVDLVLLDLMMPDVDGYQVLRVMRDNPRLKKIPVIVITAVGKRESVQHCILLGAKDYVIKPFEHVDVRTRVASTLEHKQMSEMQAGLRQQLLLEKQRTDNLIKDILPTGLKLTQETSHDRLLERIVIEAMAFCSADAGILYLRTSSDTLKFEVIRNAPLDIFMGGTTNKPCPYPPLHLMKDSSANEKNEDFAVTQAVHSARSVNINIDQDTNNDLFTTRLFNESETFRAISFLTTPLINPQGEVIGVLELINAKDPEKDLIARFSRLQEEIVEVFSRLSTVAIEVVKLRQKLDEQDKPERQPPPIPPQPTRRAPGRLSR